MGSGSEEIYTATTSGTKYRGGKEQMTYWMDAMWWVDDVRYVDELQWLEDPADQNLIETTGGNAFSWM